MSQSKQQIPEELYYDRNDVWIKVTEDQAIIGMTAHGQDNTGDILYLELAAPGTVIERGGKLGSIESGKWVGNLNSPLSGIVKASNKEVQAAPRKVNSDPYGSWLISLVISDPDELEALMKAGDYTAWVSERAAADVEME